jgi:hypothetical protein
MALRLITACLLALGAHHGTAAAVPLGAAYTSSGVTVDAAIPGPNRDALLESGPARGGDATPSQRPTKTTLVPPHSGPLPGPGNHHPDPSPKGRGGRSGRLAIGVSWEFAQWASPVTKDFKMATLPGVCDDRSVHAAWTCLALTCTPFDGS